MAGIAFRLQKLLSGDSYTDLIRAYLYSAIISTGPFLMTILTLAAIRIVIQIRLNIEDSNLLMSLIVYVFCFSIIGVSPFFYVVTRYLADKYFLKQTDSFVPSYLAVLAIIFVLQSLIIIPYLHWLHLDFNTKWVLYVFHLTCCGIWIAMAYLSAARNYMWIVWGFVAGSVTSIIGSVIMGLYLGFPGFLNGFVIGQSLCFIILTLRLFQEFGYTSFYDFGFFSYFKKHPYLVLIGVFYYTGIWVDKFVYWFSPIHDPVIKGIQVYVNYDTPYFLAFLTIVPSMAFFLVQMETSFVHYYHDYYACVRQRGSLFQIREKRQAMLENLAHNFQLYAILQGTISIVTILLIYQIADIFQLNPAQMGIFRVCILGSFLLMGLLMVINIEFYFDFQKDACIITGFFCISNFIFTLITYFIGYESYGFGFTASTFFSAWLAISLLYKKIQNLDYWTFMRQPIIVPTFKFEAEQLVSELAERKQLPEV